jgi:hypothetical protein
MVTTPVMSIAGKYLRSRLAVVLVKIEGEDLPNAATFVGWSLELREHILGDPSFTDGIVVIMVFAGEDVDIGVVIIPTVTTGLAKGTGKHGRGESQDGESSGSREMHFEWITDY